MENEFKARLQKHVEEKGAAVVAFTAVISLANVLHDKGIIDFQEFLDAFNFELEDDEREM